MTLLLQRGGIELEAGPAGLVVKGAVDFDIAAPLAEAGTKWIVEQPADSRIMLDLSGVESVSSAAVSIMLEWTRQARKAGVEIGEVRLSAPLVRLTRVAGLDTLLPLVARA
ncbi:MAG: STAS domain-containing protein [Halomonas sp.]|nr:STAS domain-containing protein [Halomonas sp.]MCC5883550.1 STAS domain-containing protein [Halomonas sp.]